MPKVTRRTDSCQDPQVAWDWVVTPPNCTPGARSPLKAEPKAPGDLHQQSLLKGPGRPQMFRVGPRGQACRRWGPRKGPPRPSMAAPTPPRGGGEHSVLDVMNCKLNTTILQRGCLQHRPQQDRAPQEFMAAPASGNSWPRPGLQQGVGRGRGACTAEKRRTPRPGRRGGRVPGAPPQPPAQGLTDAPLPPDGHWPLLQGMLGAVAPVGSQTGFQRLLSSYRKKRRCQPSAHTWAPGACNSSTPHRPPRYRGGPSVPTRGGLQTCAG